MHLSIPNFSTDHRNTKVIPLPLINSNKILFKKQLVHDEFNLLK